MKSFVLKFVVSVALLAPVVFADDFEDAIAVVDSLDAANAPGMYDVNHFEYLDCWLEEATVIVPKERSRIGAIRDEAKVCGCYTVREKGGFGWRANDEGKKIVKVWDVPKPRLLSCPQGQTCSQDFFVAQCVDHIKQSVPMLSDFAKGGVNEGAVALVFEDGGKTPFGEYAEKNKARADSINCFVNVHNRPDASAENDWRNPALFHLSGMPKKLVPSGTGRFTDYSDIRCLEKGELSGFANNGYLENLRHVDANGLVYGEEIGYMNDPTYPKKQGPEWGGILWKSNHKMGMREGVSTFYRSSVLDQRIYGRGDSTYYFKFLEVPYTQGYVNGTVRMYSDKNFLMAEIPYKRNALHGRMMVYNPFKKKPVALTFNANSLEGFVDFGDFGGVFHKGLPNGLITFWTTRDTCYQWMPGESVCYTERLTKKQWGTYKMGKFVGQMECANGQKGDVNLACPDLDSAAVKKIAMDAEIAQKEKEIARAEEAMKDAEDDLAKKKAEADSLAPKLTPEEEEALAIQKGKKALAAKKAAKKGAKPEPEEPPSAASIEVQKAELAKLEAQKALQEAQKALEEAKKAERDAEKSEREAKKAEQAEKKREAKEKARQEKAAKKKAAAEKKAAAKKKKSKKKKSE